MECKKVDTIQLKDVNGKNLSTYFVYGQVVSVHITETCIVNGAFELEKAQPILRAGGKGDYYSISTDNLFEMIRPKTNT